MMLKRSLPWWAKIGIKIIMSRLPVGYDFWKRMGLFEHGDMNQPKLALENYLLHAKSAGIINPYGEDFNVLELGPGDSAFTALIAKAYGASRVWLVDSGPFATTDPKAYDGMAAYLKARIHNFEIKSIFTDFREVLDYCNALYLTNGIASLARIPDCSVDFCFSNAVLEHIPKRDFLPMAKEILRILKPEGVCVHRIDLKDHLGGSLNNLRFSDAIWENRFFSSSGFYTNRLRYSEIINIFDQAGFNCKVPRRVTWSSLPVKRSSLSNHFKKLKDEDLLVSGFDLVLRHKVTS